MGQQSNNHQKYDLLFHWAVKQIEIQESAIESIENKAGILLAAVGIVLTAMVTLLSLDKFSLNIFVLFSFVMFSIAAYESYKTLITHQFKVSPDVLKFDKKFNNLDILQYNEKLVAVIHEAWKINGPRIDKKGDHFNTSMELYAFATFIALTGFIIQFTGGD